MAIDDKIAAEILSDCARHCCVCRKFRPLHLQIHHLIERKDGGSDNKDNLIPVCTYCHSDVHTITKLTRRFTIEELKKHRDSVYDLVAKGRLPSADNLISDQDIDYIVDQIASKINDRGHKKYQKKSLMVLYAAAVEEEKNFNYEYIQSIDVETTQLKSVSIEIGSHQFISELNENNDPAILSELLQDKLVEKTAESKYKVTLKGITLVEEEFETYDRYTLIKVKCLSCSLHFTLHTWYPEKHGRDSVSCPECKNDQGSFLVWKQKKFGFIFQDVPGNAKLEMN